MYTLTVHEDKIIMNDGAKKKTHNKMNIRLPIG